MLTPISMRHLSLDASARYVEVFCGSAALFFATSPDRAFLSDINPHLINCLIAVRDNPDGVAKALDNFENTPEFYYALRAANYADELTEERAAQFIYLNRFCFNGLYRTNKQGHFNVPYGGPSKSGQVPSLQLLRRCSEKLQNAEIVCADFETVLRSQVQSGDFVYIDPPYAKANHNLRCQYGPSVFGVEDISRLHTMLREITQRGAFFLFSYADCDEISAIRNDWPSVTVSVQRNIAAKRVFRKHANEVIVSNFPRST